MARVRVTNVVVLNNPCRFYDPFQFQITFECLELSSGKTLFFDQTTGFGRVKEAPTSLAGESYGIVAFKNLSLYCNFVKMI